MMKNGDIVFWKLPDGSEWKLKVEKEKGRLMLVSLEDKGEFIEWLSEIDPKKLRLENTEK